MDHHPVQFVTVSLTEGSSIVGNPISRDKQVAGYTRKFRVRKGDDIGQGIVLQVLDVDLVQIFIGAENVVYLTGLATPEDDYLIYPGYQLILEECGSIPALLVERN